VAFVKLTDKVILIKFCDGNKTWGLGRYSNLQLISSLLFM
jgi:hypothetical protein